MTTKTNKLAKSWASLHLKIQFRICQDFRGESWLKLPALQMEKINLALITENLSVRTLILPGPRTSRARVQCTSRTPLS